MDKREIAQLRLRAATKRIVIESVAAAFAIAGVLLIVLMAHAASFETCRNGVCVYSDTGSAESRIIHVSPDVSAAGQDSERKWLNECDPTLRRGKFGVSHYVYKKPGCEYGSPEK